MDPLSFYIFGRFVKAKCHTFLRMALSLSSAKAKCAPVLKLLWSHLAWSEFLKLNSHLPQKIVLFSFIDGPVQMMENAFYFILKALLVHKIFKFSSRLFGHV